MSPACPCTGPYWLALRVRAGASCVCRLRCPSASPPGHVSQGASRIVGLGDWLLDISVEPCQTLPVCVGPFGNDFHNAVRSSPSGPHCFSAALLVALLLANSLAEWNRLRLALCRFLRLELANFVPLFRRWQAFDSWEFVRNVLMRHVRFSPRLGEKPREFNVLLRTHAPQQMNPIRSLRRRSH